MTVAHNGRTPVRKGIHSGRYLVGLAKIRISTPPSIGSRGGESNAFGMPNSGWAVAGREGDRAGATSLGVGRA